MDTQLENVITPSTPPHTSGAEALDSSPALDSSTGSNRTKRSRTKHACDECRRTQKKCNGAKPTCSRCTLNDSQCRYTPHKARRTCAFIELHDLRRRRPVPGVCIFPHDNCARMSIADVPSRDLPYLGNLRRPRLAYDSLRRSPIVPSQSGVKGNFVHPSPSYSESSLSSSTPSSPGSVFIPPPAHSLDVRYQADTSPVFVMPSPASTVVGYRSLQQPLYSPSSQAAYAELTETQYLYNQSLASYAPQVVTHVYEDSQHDSDAIHTGNVSPLYSGNEMLPQDALHDMDRRITNAHPLPEASYQLSSSTAFSYSHDPNLAAIGLSQHQAALGIPQTLQVEEKQIQPIGNHPHERSRPHSLTASDELARKRLPFQQSFLPQTEGIYQPSLSTPQEEWSIGFSSPLYQSPPGSELSGFASHQPVECYSDGY